MSILRSQICYINSEDRIAGTSSDFQYPLDIIDGLNPDSCVVLSASIPKSYYLIRAPYNTLVLREQSTDVTITLDEGNYDGRTFATVLTNLLNSHSPNGWTYSISLDVVLAKYDFSVVGNGDNQPSIIISNHMGSQTGFDLESVNTFEDNKLRSKNVINFVSTNTLFIHSDLVDDPTSSILQEIYSDNSIPYSYIVHKCLSVDMYTKKIRNHQSSTFRFRICDEHKNPIDLNGQNIAITLMVYKRLPLSGVIDLLLTTLEKRV